MKDLIKYKEQLALLKNLECDDSLHVNLIQCGVTKKYYSDVEASIKLLVEFEKRHLQTQKIINLMGDKLDGFSDEDAKFLVLIDVIRSLEGMGHTTSITTPEGIALLMFMCRLFNIGNIYTYEDLKYIDTATISVFDIIPIIADCSDKLGNRQGLLLSEILEKNDCEIDILYRKLIYNLCKRIAEVDRRISIQEKEWLEGIARLDDDDVTNDIDMSIFD